ncbi:very short patch repair endonuclease [Anaerovibrio sp. RM50]|uniref:very short patch repair endonuclease n=1 Tax=Anaerovibrio sp. RM50 TaxID=1200557 RepID=UPI00055ECFEF|nr:very short patch repair endonuclease [Anaerovibrio sp. RM50]
MTDKQRSIIMSKIKSTNTKPERKLRLALWHNGIRYRKNWRKLPGSPDIAITKYKIAVFVDGDFWHARGHQEAPGEQVKTNKEYWVPKLTRNVERDKEVNDQLTQLGWLVLRFWESEIEKDIGAAVDEIKKFLP